MQEGSLFPTPSPALIACRFFDDDHSDRCEVIPHYSFDLHFSIFFFINLFIYYLFLTALGLCCCMQVISSCGERGLLFLAMCGLLIAVASLVVEHGLQAHVLQ